MNSYDKTFFQYQFINIETQLPQVNNQPTEAYGPINLLFITVLWKIWHESNQIIENSRTTNDQMQSRNVTRFLLLCEMDGLNKIFITWKK